MAEEDRNSQSAKAPAAGAGSMVDHLKRYKDYIGGLKQGHSSGISAAFGSALDILPAEALPRTKAPAAASQSASTSGASGGGVGAGDAGASAINAAVSSGSASSTAGANSSVAVQNASTPAESKNSIAPSHQLDESVLSEESDRAALRSSLEILVSSCAAAIDDPVGSVVRTEDGEEEVLSVYVENGTRMFMLSDLSVIDEATFLQNLVSAGDAAVVQVAAALAQQAPAEQALAAAVQPTTSAAQALAAAAQPLVAAVQSPTPASSAATRPVVNQLTELNVTMPNGTALWQIYFADYGPQLVFMADGSLIQRAEGSEQYIYAAYQNGQSLFYILSGLIVDPATGNIYLESGKGAYAAAFLNSGWRVEQVRSASGEEKYFVREPLPLGREPITTEVTSLSLNMANGEVSYETLDRSATMSLKSRQLFG